jgi:hypothetical protein
MSKDLLAKFVVAVLGATALVGVSYSAQACAVGGRTCPMWRKLELERSSNVGTLQDELRRIERGRAWIKEKTQEYPFRIIFQLRNEYELTIQSTEFGGTDKPEPIFPFFSFELQEGEGKRFIVPLNGNIRESAISKIPYRLENNRLIIESGSMNVQYRGGKQEVNLRGEYTPWFPTSSFDR